MLVEEAEVNYGNALAKCIESRRFLQFFVNNVQLDVIFVINDTITE